ncbi:uncharacterized protein C8Q71DRAFT_48878 [Rhodofomes roseus]|uniref:Uncharacterized protein n=1 Tax=Rhodofomes roseus TaxID=34475 RepID=A0ABQ8KFZ3_9APHY|nr:uncharacterized protein C8Q71DRAFT_48878 [Rhodofomes roseus]KAH9836585.1 hypothetical protein C8Q71DRAFT_48878 [Rhodofomes roseus]
MLQSGHNLKPRFKMRAGSKQLLLASFSCTTTSVYYPLPPSPLSYYAFYYPPSQQHHVLSHPHPGFQHDASASQAGAGEPGDQVPWSLRGRERPECRRVWAGNSFLCSRAWRVDSARASQRGAAERGDQVSGSLIPGLTSCLVIGASYAAGLPTHRWAGATFVRRSLSMGGRGSRGLQQLCRASEVANAGV